MDVSEWLSFLFMTIPLVLICLGMASAIVIGIMYGVSVGYQWEQIESYYWLSDGSSSPEMKVQYLNQFIDELNKSGIEDYNSGLWLATPRGKAINNINQVISLRDRVAGLINRSTADYSYASEWKQINDVEYCWIQLNNLECSYAIKNGWGIMCLFEPSYSSLCYED